MVGVPSTVLITGANRGLGLEFVRQYSADGWNVIAVCRNPKNAESLRTMAERNKKIRVEVLEVTDQKSIDALAENLKGTAIDVLINNAGVPTSGKPSIPGKKTSVTLEEQYENLNAEQCMDLFKVNTIGPLMVTRSLTPHVAGSQQKKIVMVSSRVGSLEMNFPDYMIYGCSKAALNMAIRKIALLLKPKQVKAISLHPGWVKTDMGGSGADITPEVSVSGMRQVITGLTLENSGQFITYDGKVIPW